MVILRVSSYTIKPAEPTPSSGICISDCDRYKPITHVSIIYMYRSSAGFSFASAIESFRTSLSQALVYFYPLAGRLYWTGVASTRFELDCNSMGAQLYEAESDSKLDDFGDFSPTPELRSLIPSVDYTAPLHETPLLVVQLTKLSCGGFSLGLAISRVMADGTSFCQFMSLWTRIARSGVPLPFDLLPFLDRTALLARPGPSRLLINPETFTPSPPLLMGRSNDNEERIKETTVAMLHLSKTQVEKLKNAANVSRAANIRRPYSRFEAVAGHLWRCTCKAREHQSNQNTKLYMQVSFRNRMTPPLPKGYFGNSILKIAASSQSGELMTKPLGHGSSKIREAVEMVKDDYIRSAIDLVKSQPEFLGSNFYGNPNLEITSWMGLPMEGVDFGWGKEIHMGPGSVAFDGKSFILDGHGGDGSLLIAIRLQVIHMDAFKECFYKDISSLCCCKL